MKYTFSKPCPTLSEAIRFIYKMCIPNIDNPTSHRYVHEMSSRLLNSDLSTTEFKKDEDLVWNYVSILQKYDKPKNTIERSPTSMDPFIEGDNNNVDNWFDGSTSKMQDSTLYRATGYYTLCLIKYADCLQYIKGFYSKTGIIEAVDELFDLTTLLDCNEELVLLVTYLFLGASKGEAWFNKKLEILEKFSTERLVTFNAAMAAEKSWLNDVNCFHPRSIAKVGKILSMQDFYVHPEFETNAVTCDDPITKLHDTDTSIKNLIVSQTGMGKSMYMRMISICLGRKWLDKNQIIEELSETLQIPNDIYAIYIPAYMFSYCFQNEEFKAWTSDFVELYFNCMFQLSASINFDKHEDREKKIVSSNDNYCVTEPLLKYIKELAKKGKLILIADSFDEIVAGDMRTSYLKALKKYRKDYCSFPREVGSHVFITSRDMSSHTMEELTSNIGIRLESNNVYRIKPMSSQQQKELILNWDRAFGNGIRDNIGNLNNHYFLELSANPYMLSFICNASGAKINVVTDKLISAILYYRTKSAANMLENDSLQSFFNSKQIKEVLQDLALHTVQLSKSNFPMELLSEHFMASVSDLELTDSELDFCYETMISLFTTSVGLIVPADNEDDQFQFISDQIRYELAASKIFNQIAKRGATYDAIQECLSFLSKLRNDKEYIGMVVPLICKAERNAILSERIIHHLCLRDFDKENDELVDQALMDLLLERYGLNISCSKPNPRNMTEYEHIVNADRLIILRLFSSPSFSPTSLEKTGIHNSNAFLASSGFLNASQLKFLQ